MTFANNSSVNNHEYENDLEAQAMNQLLLDPKSQTDAHNIANMRNSRTLEQYPSQRREMIKS